MQKANSFFFSKILYKNISNVSGSIIGKLNDLIMDFNADKPVIKAIEVKNGRRLSYISADSLELIRDGSENYVVRLSSSNLLVMPIPENDIFLARDFLDKQIVDINGKKVERVNDVRLGLIHGIWKLVAVDIGFRGLLRRLGAEYLAIRFTQLFHIEFRNTLIYWDNVQPLNTGVENLRLSTSLNKMRTLHAADIADIIEELDSQSRRLLFQSLDDEKAAEVLEEVESDIQRSILETLSDEKASDILEIMPSDEAADILEGIEDTRAEKLLTQMESESSEEIRELMEYEGQTVGSLMSKDFVSFLPDISVRDALQDLKKLNPGEEAAHSLYLVNSKKKLLGVISLYDMILSEADIKLYELMTPNVKSLQDEDDIDEALEVMRKYNLLYIPVLDENKEMVGTLSLSDLMYELVRLRRVAA